MSLVSIRADFLQYIPFSCIDFESANKCRSGTLDCLHLINYTVYDIASYQHTYFN